MLGPISDMLNAYTDERSAPAAALVLEALYHICEAEVWTLRVYFLIELFFICISYLFKRKKAKIKDVHNPFHCKDVQDNLFIYERSMSLE